MDREGSYLPRKHQYCRALSSTEPSLDQGIFSSPPFDDPPCWLQIRGDRLTRIRFPWFQPSDRQLRLFLGEQTESPYLIVLIPCSLPLELVKALPSQQQVLHRLVYRRLPVLGQDNKDAVATHFFRLEVPLVDLKQVRPSMGLPDGSVFAGAMFWSGSSTNLDILMPDRYGP